MYRKKAPKNILKVIHTKEQQIVRKKKIRDCKNWKNLGIEKYREKLIDETPIGIVLNHMGSNDK